MAHLQGPFNIRPHATPKANSAASAWLASVPYELPSNFESSVPSQKHIIPTEDLFFNFFLGGVVVGVCVTSVFWDGFCETNVKKDLHNP